MARSPNLAERRARETARYGVYAVVARASVFRNCLLIVRVEFYTEIPRTNFLLEPTIYGFSYDVHVSNYSENRIPDI